MKKLSFLLVLALMLAGCTSTNTNQLDPLMPGDYAAILPYKTSNARGKHVGMISDMDIRTQLETGLMDLSKEYFSPEDMAYRSHAFLTYDELDASDGSRGLLGTLRDDNPNGLNPGKDEEFDTGNGTVKGPILVADIYELDFYKNNALAGISVGLAVVDTVTIDGEEVEIASNKMKEYLDVTSTKLASYLRERFNEVTSRIPILVAAYQLNTDSTDASKGGYIYSVFFNGASTDYTTVDENHYIVPSGKFTTVDPQMAAEFSQFRESIRTILADSTYVTGDARYNDGQCSKMVLNVTTHGKTAGEVMAAAQAIRDKLSIFTNMETDYRLVMINDSTPIAIMYRPAGTIQVSVLSIL